MADFSELNNFYWFIRYSRNTSEKRKYYRYVEKGNKTLFSSTIDKICYQ